MPDIKVSKLQWKDPVLGTVPFPARPLRLKAGFGSGLCRRPEDPPGMVWAIGDRGPNLKPEEAESYGWAAPASAAGLVGAKIMPRPDIGPALARLQVSGDKVTLHETLGLSDAQGRPVSGVPVPSTGRARCEPALDLEGEPLAPDPSGMDTEGVAVLRDGSFWVSDEYGPSLARLDARGRVTLRLTPQDVELAGAPYPVAATLPAIAVRRQLNRGFEALAVSPSQTRLFLAFQSPLAHPDEETHARARHVRIWQLDSDGLVQAQYLYPLDPPESFRRDMDKGKFEKSDLKLCEMIALDDDRLLVLERGSETTKIYRVGLDEALKLPSEHLAIETRPTIEMLSASGADLPELPKSLLFSSDDHPQVSPDMEGMVLLGARSLLIVSDNDFGVGEKESHFFRIDFPFSLIEQQRPRSQRKRASPQVAEQKAKKPA